MKANLLAPAVLAIGALAAASCVGQRVIPAQAPSPAPPSATSESPPPVPPPAPSTAWIDAPATSGNWNWSMEGQQSVARFADSRLVLRCDPAARSIRIERREPSVSMRMTGATLTIRTQAQARSLAAVPQTGALAASLPARDPLLDAMAFTRGRFAVEASGMPPLYVPAWAEVGRVIEDCR